MIGQGKRKDKQRRTLLASDLVPFPSPFSSILCPLSLIRDPPVRARPARVLLLRLPTQPFQPRGRTPGPKRPSPSLSWRSKRPEATSAGPRLRRSSRRGRSRARRRPSTPYAVHGRAIDVPRGVTGPYVRHGLHPVRSLQGSPGQGSRSLPFFRSVRGDLALTRLSFGFDRRLHSGEFGMGLFQVPVQTLDGLLGLLDLGHHPLPFDPDRLGLGPMVFQDLFVCVLEAFQGGGEPVVTLSSPFEFAAEAFQLRLGDLVVATGPGPLALLLEGLGRQAVPTLIESGRRSSASARCLWASSSADCHRVSQSASTCRRSTSQPVRAASASAMSRDHSASA